MKVINVTKENFNLEIINSDLPVLIDFWAIWCGPCQMVSPIVDEVAEEADGFKVAKVNVDEQPELAQIFGIVNIPTLVVVSGGKIVNKHIGVIGKEDILKMVK